MDIASLAIAVDARQPEQAAASLDKLTAAGKRTETATNALEAEYRDATAELNRMKAAQETVTMQMGKATVVMGGVNASSRAMQANMLNLSRQGADVATMFALGAPPMQIFASQGLQIVDVLAMMKREANQTGDSLTAMSLRGLGKIGPYAIAAAAAVGLASAAFSGLASEINETSDVTVTWQDTALGAFDMVVDYLGGKVTDAFEYLGIDVANVWQTIVDGVQWAGNGIIGVFVGSSRAAIEAFRGFPGAFADLILTGVNGAIRGMEAFVNGAVELVNGFSGRINDAIGTDIGEIGGVSFGRIANQWEGQARSYGGNVAGAFSSGFQDYFGDFADAISPFAQARARERASADAESAGRAAGGRAGTAMGQGINRELETQMRGMGDLIADAARDAAEQASEEIRKAIENARIEADKNKAKREEEYRVQAEREAATIKEHAALYETLFTDGVTGVWDLFKRQGIEAISQVFARWTEAMRNGQGGGIGGLLSGLGDAFKANPIGFVAGAISTAKTLFNDLKSLVGNIASVFTGAKYGTASLTGQGAASVSAKGSGRADQATGLGGSVQSALASIADALGVGVGGYNVSIGTYKGDFRVSSTGRTGKLKGKYSDVTGFGQDEAAAVAFAVADAIKDGAILASDSIKRILAGGDIETQLAKALQFQGVFDALKEASDPTAYALEQVGKQFDALRKIFDEAGASAAEYADLEKLLGIKRQEAMDAARASKLDELTDKFGLQIRLLQLMGEGEAALTAARVLEIASLKTSLQPLQAMVYELEDARGVIAKFGPLADDLRAFKEELAGGSNSLGSVTARFRATASGAAVGDADALAAFRDDASAYLAAARDNASSALEYQRALSEVLVGADKGIFAADTQVQMAQAQIDAITSQTSLLAEMRTEIRDIGIQQVSNSGALLRLMQRWEGEGLLVRTDADTPLATVPAT